MTEKNTIQYDDTAQHRPCRIPWYELQRLDIPGQAGAVGIRKEAQRLWESEYPDTVGEQTPPQVAFLFTISERYESRELLHYRTRQALRGNVVTPGMNHTIDFVSNLFLT